MMLEVRAIELKIEQRDVVVPRKIREIVLFYVNAKVLGAVDERGPFRGKVVRQTEEQRELDPVRRGKQIVERRDDPGWVHTLACSVTKV